MFARVELALPAVAGALIAAAVMTAPSGPAYSQSAPTYNNMTGVPLILPGTPLPPDEFSKSGPFASYMYDSIVRPPRTTSTARIAYAYAPFDEPVGHVAWCQARFQSYSLLTDSYRGYDGLLHRCVSPY